MNIQNTHTLIETLLEELILCYINYISIKLSSHWSKRFYERHFCVDFIFLPRNKRYSICIRAKLNLTLGVLWGLGVCGASYYYTKQRTLPMSYGLTHAFVKEIWYIVYGCFLPTRAEWRCGDGDYSAKVKVFIVWSFTEIVFWPCFRMYGWSYIDL